MELSIVIPVYNSELSLPPLVDRLEPVLESCATAYELILVNDGSIDGSDDVVSRLVDTKDWIHGVSLMRNYGQHNALLCGIRHARYDVIVTMDDDLQHPPEEIPRLLEKLAEGYDVVYGSPQQEQHGFLRGIASRITKMVLKGAMGVDAATHVSAFRAFVKEVREAFATYSGAYVNIDVLLTWATKRFAVVYVRHDRRELGTSQYTMRMLLTHALNMMTGFSVLPLQLASMTGFFFTLFGIAVLVYVVVRWIIQGSVEPGFPFLASTIAIFSGAQLFALGIIGEYLARIHFRSMEKPSYVVRTNSVRENDDALSRKD